MKNEDSPSNLADAAANCGRVPLSTLRDGQRGRAHTSELPCDECDLLNAMGLTDQCEVRVCRRGEPCIVQVNTTRLGLAASLAQRIMITPLTSSAARER